MKAVLAFLFCAVLAASLGLVHAKSAWAAEGFIEVITALPPLYAGLEADSNATLQSLLEDKAQPAGMEEDNANRSIKRDIIAARNTFQAGEWTLARLTRFYETSQKIRQYIDVFSPSREFTILLSDDERYGAEWYATLRLLSGARYPWNALAEIPKNTHNTQTALAGRLGGEAKTDGTAAAPHN